jgi:hypothetical protein
MKTASFVFIAGMAGLMGAEKVETLRLEPAANMTRAELHHVATVPNPNAVLVLCPGCNGSGEDLIRSPKWIAFAKQNRLGLVGLSFASSMSAIEEENNGYYYASKGSGVKLLEGIRKIYGRDLPLLLYGFSGGAHFTSRFEEWNPARVLTWCAYSAGWWDEPQRNPVSPPGIVACGDEDPRYGATLIYFKQGRAAGKPWQWVSLAKTGHQGSLELDDFVRDYFSAILSQSKAAPIWTDIDREEKVSGSEQAAQPSLTGWLPSETLFAKWRKLNAP